VLLLGIIATCLLLELTASVQTALAQPEGSGSIGGKEVFAVGGRITRDTYGIYLIDPDNGTICVYQFLYNPKLKKTELHLLAARNFTFDSQLDEYNTTPSPREIRALVEQQTRLNSVEPNSE